MLSFHRTLLPVAALLGVAFLATPASAQSASVQSAGDPAEAPLFQGTEPIQIRIEADFDQIKDDRDEENPEREGQVFVIGADGSETMLPVQVRTRGRFRLQSNTCQFPPIRLNFPKSAVEGSVFEGQDKIKLVTHCRDRYEANVVKEYLVYRIYNELTPASFKARMARVTYVDTSGEEETIERLAFFIEMEEAMAARLGGEVMSDEEQALGIHPARIQSVDASRVSLFQYMVGNTDWSLYGFAGSGPHNSVPVIRGDGRLVPVPYDFDWTGLVDANYARPDQSLGIRNVKQRVFRGLCRGDIDYPALYQRFMSRRPAITALVNNETLLDEDDREDVLDYLDEFWETLESERNSERRIERACRPV